MSKIWLDKVASGEVKAFPDQRFYAVQYEGEHAELVARMADTVQTFNKWAFEYYHAHRSGTPLPEFPFAPFEEEAPSAETAPKQSKKGGTESGPQKRVRARSSKTTDGE